MKKEDALVLDSATSERLSLMNLPESSRLNTFGRDHEVGINVSKHPKSYRLSRSALLTPETSLREKIMLSIPVVVDGKDKKTLYIFRDRDEPSVTNVEYRRYNNVDNLNYSGKQTLLSGIMHDGKNGVTNKLVIPFSAVLVDGNIDKKDFVLTAFRSGEEFRHMVDFKLRGYEMSEAGFELLETPKLETNWKQVHMKEQSLTMNALVQALSQDLENTVHITSDMTEIKLPDEKEMSTLEKQQQEMKMLQLEAPQLAEQFSDIKDKLSRLSEQDPSAERDASREITMERVNDIVSGYLMVQRNESIENADSYLERSHNALESIQTKLEKELTELDKEDLYDFEVSLRLIEQENGLNL